MSSKSLTIEQLRYAQELQNDWWEAVDMDRSTRPELIDPSTIGIAAGMLLARLAAEQKGEFTEDELRAQCAKIVQVAVDVYPEIRKDLLKVGNR